MSEAFTESLEQNLLTSSKRPSKPEQTPEEEAASTEPLTRKWARSILYTLFYLTLAIVAFLAFLLPKLPYQTMGDSALNQLSVSTPYIWKAKAITTSILGPSVKMTELALVSKPFGYGSREPQKRILVESLSVSPSFSMIPIPWLRPNPAPAGSFELSAYKGKLAGKVSQSSGDTHIDIAGSKFDIEKLAAAMQLHDLDLKGVIEEISAAGSMTQQKFSRSNGNLVIKIKGLQLDPAGFNLGMPLPILNLGEAKIQGTIRNGRMIFDRTQLGGPKEDLEMFVEGSITLRDPVEMSDIDILLRLKFAPKITTLMPYIESFLKAGKRPDGFYGLKISGNLISPGIPQPHSGP